METFDVETCRDVETFTSRRLDVETCKTFPRRGEFKETPRGGSYERVEEAVSFFSRKARRGNVSGFRTLKAKGIEMKTKGSNE